MDAAAEASALARAQTSRGVQCDRRPARCAHSPESAWHLTSMVTSPRPTRCPSPSPPSSPTAPVRRARLVPHPPPLSQDGAARADLVPTPRPTPTALAEVPTPRDARTDGGARRGAARRRRCGARLARRWCAASYASTTGCPRRRLRPGPRARPTTTSMRGVFGGPEELVLPSDAPPTRADAATHATTYAKPAPGPAQGRPRAPTPPPAGDELAATASRPRRYRRQHGRRRRAPSGAAALPDPGQGRRAASHRRRHAGRAASFVPATGRSPVCCRRRSRRAPTS